MLGVPMPSLNGKSNTGAETPLANTSKSYRLQYQGLAPMTAASELIMYATELSPLTPL